MEVPVDHRQAESVAIPTSSVADGYNTVRVAARRLLAVVMVIGPLTQVVAILVLPWIGSDDYVSAVRASADRYPTYAWLAMAGALTLAPAGLGGGVAGWGTPAGGAAAAPRPSPPRPLTTPPH